MAYFNKKLLKSHKPCALLPNVESEASKGRALAKVPTSPRQQRKGRVPGRPRGGARRGCSALAEGFRLGFDPGPPGHARDSNTLPASSLGSRPAPKIRAPTQTCPRAHLLRRSQGRRDTCAGRCREKRTPAGRWGRGPAQSTPALRQALCRAGRRWGQWRREESAGSASPRGRLLPN